MRLVAKDPKKYAEARDIGDVDSWSPVAAATTFLHEFDVFVCSSTPPVGRVEDERGADGCSHIAKVGTVPDERDVVCRSWFPTNAVVAVSEAVDVVACSSAMAVCTTAAEARDVGIRLATYR